MTVKKELESVQDKLNINSKNNILNRQLNIIQDSVKTNRGELPRPQGSRLPASTTERSDTVSQEVPVSTGVNSVNP